MRPNRVSGISIRFRMLSQSSRQVTYVLLTRPPLTIREASFSSSPLDLHVLGTPPAFVLSQDQTLHKSYEVSLLAHFVVFVADLQFLRITGLFARCSVFKEQIFLLPSSPHLSAATLLI